MCSQQNVRQNTDKGRTPSPRIDIKIPESAGSRTRAAELCSSSNLYVTSPTSQLILQPFRRFTYVTAHSPNLPLPHLHHSSFSNPSFASPTPKALHLCHLASRPWKFFTVFSKVIYFYLILTL